MLDAGLIRIGSDDEAVRPIRRLSPSDLSAPFSPATLNSTPLTPISPKRVLPTPNPFPRSKPIQHPSQLTQSRAIMSTNYQDPFSPDNPNMYTFTDIYEAAKFLGVPGPPRGPVYDKSIPKLLKKCLAKAATPAEWPFSSSIRNSP
jgi:hypothetical protein